MPLSVHPIKNAAELNLYRSLIAQIFPAQQHAPGQFRDGGRVNYLAHLHDTTLIGVGSILYGDPQSSGDTEIFNIGVSPDHRGAGYGRRILMHLCADANRCRPTQDRIIFPHAANAGFYESFGFVAEGPAPSEDGEPRIRMRQRAKIEHLGPNAVRHDAFETII